MAIHHHVEFLKGKILSKEVWRTEVRHHAKFCRNSSINRGDIAIFRLLKMAAAAMLDLRNREILLAEGIEMAEMHHHSKFRQNRPIHCGDIVFFDF